VGQLLERYVQGLDGSRDGAAGSRGPDGPAHRDGIEHVPERRHHGRRDPGQHASDVTAPASQTATEGTPKLFSLGSFSFPDGPATATVRIEIADSDGASAVDAKTVTILAPA
jgi:hypothetical protein